MNVIDSTGTAALSWAAFPVTGLQCGGGGTSSLSLLVP